MSSSNRRQETIDALQGVAGIILIIVVILIFSNSSKTQYSTDTPGIEGMDFQATQSLDNSPPSFNGYSCTQDCSGHEAGYDWANRKGITDPDDCGGKSESFIVGCRAYAEENQNIDSSSDGE